MDTGYGIKRACGRIEWIERACLQKEQFALHNQQAMLFLIMCQ